MNIRDALSLLAEIHTSAVDDLGFVVHMGAKPEPYHLRRDGEYIEAWGAVRDFLRAPVDDWQPMETAPKGGGAERVDDPAYVTPPRILLRFGTEAVSVAYWEAYYAEGGNGCTDGFAWVEPVSGEPLNICYSTEPNGWMPISGLAETGNAQMKLSNDFEVI